MVGLGGVDCQGSDEGGVVEDGDVVAVADDVDGVSGPAGADADLGAGVGDDALAADDDPGVGGGCG